jgi:hypothetical protein
MIMLVPREEAELFFALYASVIGFAAGRSGDIEGVKDAATFRSAPNEVKAQARDHFLEHAECLPDYMERNPDRFGEHELSYFAHWSHLVQGNFIVERDLKKYTVFLTTDDRPKAYGVLGLTDEIVDLVAYPLPMLVKAVLLPWKDRIIWDGLFSHHSIVLGPGIRKSIRESYRRAKQSGIITSLDPAWKPPKPTRSAKKPKTPAIYRFLKRKCPKMVAEFKATYGEPRMELAGDAAREYSPWSPQGTPMIDTDLLLIYANIIRYQVLYVYAKEGVIICVSVVDPTDWSRSDFTPYRRR